MVCDDCTSKLSVLSAPDPLGMRGGAASGPKRGGENTLLRKGVRANPYGNCCKICKMKVQQNSATYCTVCAYSKGICAICGKQVLDTTMYKMSDGGGYHKMGNREEAAYKSEAQITRENAQQALLEHLASTGQVGRMPTKAALEKSGKKQLALDLVASFGGLHAAADAMGLSKRLLNDEAEERKQAKQRAAQEAAERKREAAANAAAAASGAAAATPAAAAVQAATDAAAPAGGGAPDDDDDAPPGVATPAASSSEADGAAAAAAAASREEMLAALKAAAAGKKAAAPLAPPPPPAASVDASWQYDPNSGLYFQLSTQCYFDAKANQYFKNGVWSKELPA